MNVLIILFSSILLLPLISGCNKSERIRPIKADHSETIYNVYSLSNQTGETPIISAVSLVTTDSNNNIYLVDPRTMEIHALTGDLSHCWTTGGKGSGPGLFNFISALYTDDEHLYVYENAGSTVTVYSLEGARLNDWSFGEAGHKMNGMDQFDNGNFLITGWNEKSETVLNIYDKNLKKRLKRFHKIDGILNTGNPNFERQVLRNYPGAAVPVNDSTVIYAAPAYNGWLDIFRLQSDGNWEKTDSIKGYSSIKEPVIFHKSQDGNHDRSHLSGFNPEGGYFHTEFISMSHGLFKIQDGKIAHLSTFLNKNDEWDIIVEYINPVELNLGDFILLESVIATQQFQQVPLWMDKTGRIYLNENSDTPLRILEIRQ